jgi:hypothetical protein
MTPVALDRLAARWRDRESRRGAGAGERVTGSTYLAIIAAAAIAFVVAFLRRPETLTRAEFWAEDGPVFYLGTFSGPGLLDSYEGFLYTGQRIIAIVSRLVPVEYAPLVANALSLGCVAALAAFLASGRIPLSKPQRVMLALGIVAMPAVGEVSGTMTNLGWYGAIYLGAVAFARTATGKAAWAERVIVAIAALSGPFAIIVAPLYAGRWWRDREWAWAWLAVIVGVASVIQVIAFVMGERTMMGGPPPSGAAVVEGWAIRGVMVPFLGQRFAELLAFAWPLAAFLLAGVVTTLLRLRLAGAALGYFIVIMTVLGLWTTNLWGLREVVDGGRYFMPVGFAILATLVAVRSWLSLALLAVMVVGIVGDFRLEPRAYLGWAQTSHCIGGPEPCVVPIHPGVQLRWEP